MESLKVITSQDGSYAVITVIGDVDATTTGYLQDKVTEARSLSNDLIFDLTGMTFMDSAGIRVLLDAYHHTLAHEGTIVVCGPRPSPRKVMELVGLAESIPIYATLADALAR